jgi:hypothetical protein
MSACKLLRRWLPDGRSRSPRVRSRTQPAGAGWLCLELADRPAEPSLRIARELVVRHPGELTLAVLAAAPALVAVVLPEQSRLPPSVVAELARRQLAIIWRQPPVAPVLPRAAVCAMSRPGSMS